MCRRVKCSVCGKTTWAGCGQHVDEVMAGVPASQRCTGHDGASESSAAKSGWGARVAGWLRGR